MGFDGNTSLTSKTAIGQHNVYLNETLTISDSWNVYADLLKVEIDETVTISDLIEFSQQRDYALTDTATFTDSFDVETRNRVMSDLTNDFRTVALVRNDITNKFNMHISGLNDINNKFNFVDLDLNDVYNTIDFVQRVLNDIDNKFNTKKLVLNNINNKFNMLLSWQVPGSSGVPSRGKEYIKVYFDDVEQTDVDVDSIRISKILNGAASANFTLGRAYDVTLPTLESEVEIKYDAWTLFKGYITEINPIEDDSKDQIEIQCKDKFWYDNKSRVYFRVGHEPEESTDKYYETISEALSTGCSVGLGIGNFVPQSMDLFGTPKAEAITELVTNSGTYGWFYDTNETTKLWIAGSGNIIELDKQEIGTNLNIFQVLSHDIKETVEEVINRYRVHMGEEIKSRREGRSYIYMGYNSIYYAEENCLPLWDANYEKLAYPGGNEAYGLNYHKVEDAYLYKDIFRKYKLPDLDPDAASWSDSFPPQVFIKYNGVYGGGFGFSTFGGKLVWTIEADDILTDGFTVDFEEGTLTFDQPLFAVGEVSTGVYRAYRPHVSIILGKRQWYQYTVNPDDDPEQDDSNELVFFTSVSSNYNGTITGVLELPGLSIGRGGYYYDRSSGSTVRVHLPSWDDTDFAEDVAKWKLSEISDKKMEGTIELTLDAMCLYGITLANRIKIDGVTDNALNDTLNIESMQYNLNNFTVTLNLKNGRTYARSVSLPFRG